MVSLDFSRSDEVEIIAKDQRLLDGILDCARSDEAAVDFSGEEIIMELYNSSGNKLITTWSTSGGEISVIIDQIVLDQILQNTELPKGKYQHLIYNDDDKIGIGHGPFTVT